MPLQAGTSAAGSYGNDWIGSRGGRREKGNRSGVLPAGSQRSPNLDDDSTVERVDEVAAGLWEAMTGTLDEFTKKKRWWSMRWWSSDLKKLRKELGRAKRDLRPAGISRIRDACRNLRRAIQRAKREC
jgi:hypothetical protein